MEVRDIQFIISMLPDNRMISESRAYDQLQRKSAVRAYGWTDYIAIGAFVFIRQPTFGFDDFLCHQLTKRYRRRKNTCEKVANITL